MFGIKFRNLAHLYGYTIEAEQLALRPILQLSAANSVRAFYGNSSARKVHTADIPAEKLELADEQYIKLSKSG